MARKVPELNSKLQQQPNESLTAYYRRIAKVADQRLVRLEALQHEKNYTVVTQWSYAKALEDIRHWSSKEGAKRFNTAPPQTVQQLKAKIGDIENFLASPTSTKRTITKIYEKRANTLNEKYGTNFSWDNIATFYESQHYRNLVERYKSSDIITRAIADIQQKEKDVVNAIKKDNEVSIKASDEMLQSVVDDVINEMGTDISKLF